MQPERPKPQRVRTDRLAPTRAEFGVVFRSGIGGRLGRAGDPGRRRGASAHCSRHTRLWPIPPTIPTTSPRPRARGAIPTDTAR